MAAGLGREILIKLRAEFDTKGLSKSTQSALILMRKLADNTSKNLNKTVESVQNATTESVNIIKSDIESLNQEFNGDMFERAANAVKVFQNRVTELGKVNTVDALTAQTFEYEKRLATTAGLILNLKKEFIELKEAANLKDMIVFNYGSIENARNRVRELRNEAGELGKRMFEQRGIERFGPSVTEPFEKQMEEIEKVRTKLQELKVERQEMASNAANRGTEEWTQQLKDLDTEITKTTSLLGRLTKEFYAMGRSAGLGTDKNTIMANYTDLQRYTDIGREIASLQTALDKIAGFSNNNAGETLFSELGTLSTSFESILNILNGVKEGLEQSDEETKKINADAQKTHASFAQWRNVVWSVSRVIGNMYTIGLDIVRGAKQIANFYMKIWNAAKKVLSVFKSLRDKIRGTANEHAKSWKQMLKDIIKYSLGIRSLFALFRRLRGYIKEAFTEMAKQIPEVNAQLSSLKSSFNAMKGSMATALEPLMSALHTWLVAIIDKISQLLTYVGMLFAALSGRGFVYQAKKVATSFADAAGSAKEMNKQLQGFDELNNLTSDKGSGGGGDSPIAQFEKLDIPDWMKNLAQKIKDIWDKIIGPIKEAWAKVGDYVVAAWKRAFNNIKDLLSDIGRDFLDVWSRMGEHIAETFFLIVGDIGNIIANVAEKMRDAWNFVAEGSEKSNGVRFWEAILTIVDRILVGVRAITADMVEWTSTLNITPAFTAFVEWLESLIPLVDMVMGILFDFWNDALKPILTWAFDGEDSGIARFFKILKKFNDDLDTEKIRSDLDIIWKAVGRFGITIGEGLLIFIERMLGYLKNWLNSDDFTEWCQKVADFLDNIKPEDLADDLEQVWRIIKNIAEAVWEAIKVVIDHKDQILDVLEWASEHLQLIAGIFLGGKLAIDTARFIANILLLGGSIAKVFGGLTTGAEAVGAVLSTISGAIAPILVGVAAIVAVGYSMVKSYGSVEELFKKIKSVASDVFNSLKSYAEKLGLADKIQKLKEKIGDLLQSLGGLKSLWDTLFALLKMVVTYIGGTVMAVINAILPVISGVIGVITGIIEILGGLFDILVGFFTGNKDLVVQGAEKLWEGIKDAFHGGVELVVGILKGFVDLIIAPFKTIKYMLVGDPIVVDMWNDIKDVFDKSIGKIIEFVTNLKDKIIKLFMDIANGVAEKIANIKTKFEEWKANIETLKESVAQKLDNIKSKVKEKFDDIKQHIDDLKSKWKEKFEDIKSNIEDFVTKVASKFDNAKSKIETFKTNVSNTFSDLKTSIVNAFESIKDGIKTPINSALGFVEKFVNGVIRAINNLGDRLSDFKFDVPDLLADKFDLPTNFSIKVPHLSEISLPRLAKGAVIPPNNEFLAVLGDQKRGTNIETPLDTMIQAFNEANRGGSEQELRLLQEQNELLRQLLNKEFGISERQIYNSVINQDNIRRKSTGSSAFAY